MKPPAKNTYFNPPTPCGVGRRSDRGSTQTEKHFNPPTPCGWDRQANSSCLCHSHFNPPTPCGVGQAGVQLFVSLIQFQSTHPLRGGPHRRSSLSRDNRISIHPPLAGWDRVRVCGFCPQPEFQSTHPLRGGTRRNRTYGNRVYISIHPPLAGWTEIFWTKTETYLDFNPPTPCGVGQQKHTGKFCCFMQNP